MRLSIFLKEKWLFCITQIGMILFVGVMLSVYGISDYGIGFVCIAMVLVDSGVLAVEYFQKHMYYHKILKISEALDKQTLMSELIEEPSFEEGKIWWLLLQRANKSMNDEIATYRILQEEYKTYIEAWIHEIKTPIASTRLMCENHKNDFTKVLGNEVSKIDSFVEQALFYARSTSLEKDYVIKEISLNDLVRGTIKKHARLLIEKKIILQLEQLDYKVFADSKWVDFILGQLLSNSIKYDTTTLKCEAVEKDEQILLTIADNGVGIPMQDIGRVFNKGFTGENGRIYGKSTGIGLYLCKKLCDKMHLGISLVSEQGVGTTVTLVFPKDKRIFFEEE